ncbi:DNA methyltransferase [Brevibacillus laterosporus]|uniref:DNA methyltransferase n=1 Tax=Brevibacillus laterosporus TaxID=1465 RepID=UPI0035A727C7
MFLCRKEKEHLRFEQWIKQGRGTCIGVDYKPWLKIQDVSSKGRSTRSKHTKWMKAMMPCLHMMWKMLKPTGVIAICIDDNELFHLGMMMNEVFGEENRIGIINWQKSYSSKNDSKHVSTAAEYVLVYAKDKSIAKTGLLPREDSTNSKYKNPDNDPEGLWRSSDATVA